MKVDLDLSSRESVGVKDVAGGLRKDDREHSVLEGVVAGRKKKRSTQREKRKGEGGRQSARGFRLEAGERAKGDKKLEK